MTDINKYQPIPLEKVTAELIQKDASSDVIFKYESDETVRFNYAKAKYVERAASELVTQVEEYTMRAGSRSQLLNAKKQLARIISL